MKKVYTLIFTVAIIALAASVAFAGPFRVHGKGILGAIGDGSAAMFGSGEMRLWGNGFLMVTDNAVVDIIEGTGEAIDIGGGYRLYVGFNGQARIEGDDIEVALAGSSIRLGVRGEGTVILEGRGRYRIGLKSGFWGPTSTEIDFEPLVEE